ncbi:uncharacterized protein LOC120328053 isoform X1 [Styela clava]
MERRSCIIYLPNHSKLDLSVNPKQLGKDLWDIVVSELELTEEDYFGLKYKTTGDHYAWLQGDKKVLDHDIEMKSTNFPLEFTFSVKFYEDSVTVHKHASTVELIFLYAQNQIYKGEIYVPCDLSLELAALAMQAFYGDFISEETACANYKNLSCLPRSVILELPSIEYCEDQVISWYKSFCGISRGQAILLYMCKAEKLANYGVHFFKVKDKTRLTWWLGISNKGIYQYNYTDTINPHTVFQWRNLENLYFREKKFSVEVCSGHKRSHSSGFTNSSDKSKKSGNNRQQPITHTWYGSPQLIKSIWIMAIAQHQFYWDRKQSSKSKSQTNRTNATNIRNALDKNSNSFVVPPAETDDKMPKKNHNNKYAEVKSYKKVSSHGNGRVHHSHSHQHKQQQSPEILELEKKMVSDLKQRKLDLEDRLFEKVQELKSVCLEEFHITEKLPIDYIRYMTMDEEKPVIRKKIETKFPVQLRQHTNKGNHFDQSVTDQLQQLESDYELLNQITNAAYKLAYDPSSHGKIRRNRLQSYQKSLKKLQDMENRIDELRTKQGKDPALRHSTFITTSDTEILAAMKECSIDEKSERSSLSDGILLEDGASISSGAEALSTHSTPALSLHPDTSSADVDMDDLNIQRSKTPPPTRSKVAWLESPKVKGNKSQHMISNHSYPVLPSPTSNRSTASSGTDTPPYQTRSRDWVQTKWEHPRHHADWKVSSLDSLESNGSRKSSEHNLSHSPSRRKILANGENANAMRIARATESARAHKVSLREKQRSAAEPSHRMGTINPVLEIIQDTVPDDGKDSRTSLTDSGHGTDSRAQLYYEEELARKRLGANSIRRDISDSSLSELSTQSNPAALPSSGHVPKFVPYFMSRPRAVTQAPLQEVSVQQNEASHVRKRSSSFTESGSNIQKPVSRRDNHRTLTRSKTHYENDTLTKDSVRDENFDSNDDISASDNNSCGLSSSQSANNLPPPTFETNLNICKQYLSRSQGQLANAQNNQTTAIQNNPSSEEQTTEVPYSSVSQKQSWSNVTAKSAGTVSANNSNNKPNFGQIYQLSQSRSGAYNTKLRDQPNRSETPQGTSLLAHHNIPRGNSLDSILDRGHSTDTELNPDTMKNFSVEPEHSNKFYGAQDHQYPRYQGSQYSRTTTYQRLDATNQVGNLLPNMSVMDRDKFNNEAFQEIQGMGWVPSLDDYGSRASVAESLPAKSKKEDIMELLQQHIAHNWVPRRTPSTSSTNTMRNKMDRKLQAKIRAEMMKEKDSKPANADPAAKTWEGYKQNVQTMKRSTQQPSSPGKSEQASGVNIFAHKQPPPLSSQQQNVLGQRNLNKPMDTASEYSQNTIHKGYIDKNGFISFNDHRSNQLRKYSAPVNNFATSRQIRSQQTNYPDYPGSNPFERGYLSATLPRKYVSKEGSPKRPQTTYTLADLQRTYSYTTGDPNDFYPTTANFNSSPENLPRTYSHPVGEYIADDYNSHPTGGYIDRTTRRQNPTQHSTNFMSVTQPVTSLSHNFPATGNAANMTDARKLASGFTATMSQQAKSSHRISQQTGYRQQQQQIKGKDIEETTGTEYQSTKPIPSSEDTALVVQATRTSPDGHKVSVFTVTKSTPSTPDKLKTLDRKNKDDENPFFFKTPVKQKLKTSLSQPESNNSPLSPSAASDISSQSNTDVLQALAIEAARVAQKALADSQKNLDKYSLKNNLEPDQTSSPPNFNLRSSTRERRATGDFLSPLPKSMDDPTPMQNSVQGETKTPRSRSKTRNDRDSSTGRSSQPVALNDDGVCYPVKDLRNESKSQNNSHKTNFTPMFQRTLSTPIRSRPGGTRSGNGTKMALSTPNKKKTGMYNESVSGSSSKVRPPAAPRGNNTPSRPPQAVKDVKQQNASRRQQYQIGQSGTLPRTPRSAKKIERSGSTSGSAPPRSTVSSSQAKTMRSQNDSSYSISVQRNDMYNALYGIQDLKYKRRSFTEAISQSSRATTPTPSQCREMVVGASKPPLSIYQTATRCKTASVNLKRKNTHRRSMSETWKQPGGLGQVQQQYQVAPLSSQQHHHHYHHMGHQGMVPTTGDPRLAHEPPRRTASADDLLWPEQREGSYNLSSQQGTLV